MGQNASPEGRAELRQPGTRLIGSVAYFPEKYGAEIVAVALDILNRRPVPPAVFVKHQLVTPENVDHIYPERSADPDYRGHALLSGALRAQRRNASGNPPSTGIT